MIIADIDLLVQCCVLLMISLYASVLNVRIITEVSIPLLKSFKHSILPLFSYNVVLVISSTIDMKAYMCLIHLEALP